MIKKSIEWFRKKIALERDACISAGLSLIRNSVQVTSLYVVMFNDRKVDSIWSRKDWAKERLNLLINDTAWSCHVSDLRIENWPINSVANILTSWRENDCNGITNPSFEDGV